MTTVVGEKGANVRSDVWIEATDSPQAGYDLETSVEAVYGRSLRAQIERKLAEFGQPPVHLNLVDSGALPFAVEGRLDAVLCAHLNLPLPNLESRIANSAPKRLRRTRLYVPGNGPKLFPNAGLYRPDGLILDLEDSVAPEAKFAARALVRRALAALDFDGAERMIRINAGEEGLRDLEAVAPQSVEAVLVPKADSPEVIRDVAAKLDELDSDALLIPLLESALAVQNAYAVATASPRVVALAIGLEDYSTDIRAERTAEGGESAYAHGALVNAARAAGVSPLASVFPGVDDPEAMRTYARRARSLGFDGVGCIHPRQIRSAHEGFAPTPEETASARAIVEGYENALAEGRGAVSVNGRMVDAPVYERAKTILSRGSAPGTLSTPGGRGQGEGGEYAKGGLR